MVLIVVRAAIIALMVIVRIAVIVWHTTAAGQYQSCCDKQRQFHLTPSGSPAVVDGN